MPLGEKQTMRAFWPLTEAGRGWLAACGAGGLTGAASARGAGAWDGCVPDGCCAGAASLRARGGSCCSVRAVAARSMATMGLAAPGAGSSSQAPAGWPRRSAYWMRASTDSASLRSTRVLRDLMPARRRILARSSAALAGREASSLLSSEVAWLATCRSARTSCLSVPRARATVSVAGPMPIRVRTSFIVVCLGTGQEDPGRKGRKMREDGRDQPGVPVEAVTVSAQA